MAKGKNQHVVKHSDGWAVKGEGNSKQCSSVPFLGSVICVHRCGFVVSTLFAPFAYFAVKKRIFL